MPPGHIYYKTPPRIDLYKIFSFTILYTGASGASSKWVGTIKNYSTDSKKWVGKCPFSMKVKQKSGWARAHPAHLAPTPLTYYVQNN